MNAVNKKANANGLTVGDNTYPIKKLKVCNIHGTTIDYAELPNGTKFVMNTEPFKSGYSHALSIGDVYLCFHSNGNNNGNSCVNNMIDELFRLENMLKEYTVSAEFLLGSCLIFCVNLVDYLKS